MVDAVANKNAEGEETMYVVGLLRGEETMRRVKLGSQLMDKTLKKSDRAAKENKMMGPLESAGKIFSRFHLFRNRRYTLVV